ncbi:MAG TPA: DNA-processing protein DprA [Steroidobacteraceae bacterium]|jgi:DNA processing protein|nr:DNA-processing protein DprA [Steroidobacteraceae bacterium]
MDLIEAQLRLGRARGLTARSVQALLGSFGEQRPHDLLALCERSSLARAALLRVDRARIDADRRWLQRQAITLLDIASPDYPPQLLLIGDPPRLLYCSGRIDALRRTQLAMVGSRRPTMPGALTAREFAGELSLAGLTITSGLALGIDAASHEGALTAGGLTIAVLGSGLDDIYPAEHRALAARIASSGAVISEFPPGTAPRHCHFPRRNRIISGLSRALLVIEAALGSGSLTSARSALTQGRQVFAVPGSIRNPLAHGCHELIRGGAKLIERPAQILEELHFIAPKQMLMTFQQGARERVPSRAKLDKEYEILLDAVGFEAASLDMLVDRTGLPSQSVASMLLILELEGAVGRQADGQYVCL